MSIRKTVRWAGFLAGISLTASSVFAAKTQGVSDTEIVLGGHHDLSGPFSAFSAPAVKAAQLYFDEVNKKGGVHGRKIRYIVEDHGYQVPKAVQAVNKLVNRDKVFAMLLSLGTPHNLAAFRVLDRKGVPNVAPLSAARQMLQDPYENKFAFMSTYYDQMRVGITYLKQQQAVSVACAMYIPSDYGKDVYSGAQLGAKESGLTWGGETTHKADDSDFSGALAKLKSLNCDVVALALSVRGTITALSSAKKMGWDSVHFIGSSASFHTAVAKVPGGVTDGFWAAAGWRDLESRKSEPDVEAWITQYTEATGEAFPGSGAILGRTAAEIIVRGLESAGRELTVKSFRDGMENLSYRDLATGNMIKTSLGDHQAMESVYISRIEKGQWKSQSKGL